MCIALAKLIKLCPQTRSTASLMGFVVAVHSKAVKYILICCVLHFVNPSSLMHAATPFLTTSTMFEC